jgi:hypothetical protein
MLYYYLLYFTHKGKGKGAGLRLQLRFDSGALQAVNLPLCCVLCASRCCKLWSSDSKKPMRDIERLLAAPLCVQSGLLVSKIKIAQATNIFPKAVSQGRLCAAYLR